MFFKIFVSKKSIYFTNYSHAKHSLLQNQYTNTFSIFVHIDERIYQT